MALRPLLFAAVVGIAALGTFHSPAAQAEGFISISVGTPSPYYRGDAYGGNYRRGHRSDVVWVPAHWVSTHRGRVLVPGRYVQARGYNRGYGYGQDRYRHNPRVIHRAAPIRPLPGAFYQQRGGRSYDAYYGRDGYRGW